MAAIFFTKSSGVVTVTQTTGQAKSYFGLVGSFNPNPAGTGFLIQIGSAPFNVLLADLRVNGQTPSTMAEGATLLNSIFGS